MDKKEEMKMMKLRILRSFKWNEWIVVPIAKEFDISEEEFEEVLLNRLDMSELENLLATFEIANKDTLVKQLYIDLRCNWFSDVLNLIPKEDCLEICSNLAIDVYAGRDYDEALKEGRAEILKILK